MLTIEEMINYNHLTVRNMPQMFRRSNNKLPRRYLSIATFLSGDYMLKLEERLGASHVVMEIRLEKAQVAMEERLEKAQDLMNLLHLSFLLFFI